jgi:hypothetical protein
LTVPPGRTRKRFFALLFVFILGMTNLSSGQLHFDMIAGGNTSLHLDACSHLLCGGIEPVAIA